VDVAAAYVELAERELAAGKLAEFLDFHKRASDVASTVPEGADLAARIAQRNTALRDEALEAARKAVAAWDRDGARAGFERALAFDPQSAVAQRGLRGADRIGRPGFVFRDARGAAEGPEMVVVEAAGRRLAAARNETTLADFRAFWNDGGATMRPERPSCRNREGFFSASRNRSFESPTIEQGADHPVVCVAPGDADAYAQWLSQRTGKRYRLPTSAEWLALAAKAPAPGDCKANLADAAFRTKFRGDNVVACDDGFAATAPVRRFEAPAGAVYDIAGNVREWVSDCPSNCRERTAMGSAWHTGADGAEPTQRETFARDVASNTVGFRVVREID
jgi:formylglycine-generating enzyme required for sulfatase activity